MNHRRNFVASVGAAGMLAATDTIIRNDSNGFAWGQPLATEQPASTGPQKRIAIVTTLWSYLSHGQHMGDRFLVGYPMDGRWQSPRTQVVSAFVAQKPDSDLSASRSQEFGFTVYPSIAEALRCGGKQLAVDAVVVIGEHGEYPRNDKGQILYPRYEFFQEAVKVFEQDGRSVPMFNDKHLSYSAELAARMVQDSKRLNFPFLAGSSVPVSYRNPSVDLPYGAQVAEALAIGMGTVDHTAFHVYEGLQAMLERRQGGESGVRSVQLLEGAAVWQAGREGRWSMRLLEAALSRSDSLGGDSELDSRPQDLVRNGKMPQMLDEEPHIAILIEYNDAVRAAVLMLNGIVGDFNAAVQLKGDQIVSTQFYLPPEPNVAYSGLLMAHVEEMIVSGKAGYPIERTLLTSSVIERALDSKVAGFKRIETPDLNIRYQTPDRKLFGVTNGGTR